LERLLTHDMSAAAPSEEARLSFIDSVRDDRDGLRAHPVTRCLVALHETARRPIQPGTDVEVRRDERLRSQAGLAFTSMLGEVEGWFMAGAWRHAATSPPRPALDGPGPWPAT